LGSVIARYQGINGYDWVAIPLLPYLYSVEDASEVPARADREMVRRLRDRYREAHLLSLGANLARGNVMHGGWTQLVGLSYERRIYAFRFETSEAQDDAFIARMNDGRIAHLSTSCSPTARILRVRNSIFTFPAHSGAASFPDAGMTTPKQIAYKLVRYARSILRRN
jgi:hypothetical protein